MGSQKMKKRKRSVAARPAATGTPMSLSMATETASKTPSPPGNTPSVRASVESMKLAKTGAGLTPRPRALSMIQSVPASSATIASCRPVHRVMSETSLAMAGVASPSARSAGLMKGSCMSQLGSFRPRLTQRRAKGTAAATGAKMTAGTAINGVSSPRTQTMPRAMHRART
jgi:hypothetical protein